jgi:hypothetical protein
MPATQDTYEYKGEQFTITCHLILGQIPKVVFQGAMRMESAEEAPVLELLQRVVDHALGEDYVIIDLHDLGFINSQGISVLYKFAINLRNVNVNVNIFAVKQSVWQQATLNNILKLSPDSTITWSEEAS